MASAASGCATTGGPRPDAPAERLVMEPMTFVARKTDAGVVVDSHDAAGLFRAGGVAFEDGRYTDAIDRYSALLTEYPESSYARAARYNVALALEKVGRHLDAIRVYRVVAEDPADPKDALDAVFRIAECYETLQDWENAQQTLGSILVRTDLTDEERAEAEVRRGSALIELGRLDEAETALRAVLRRHKQGSPRPLLATNQFLAQAQHGVARIDHQRFSKVPIRLPQEVMAQDIQEKARTFLRAQAGYLRAMGFKDRFWSSKSGLHIGALYEDFYNDLMAAPVPPELNSEETEVYFEELRKLIHPLVKRAIYVYEKNLRLAEGLGTENAVLIETRGRLERLRRFVTPNGGEAGNGGDGEHGPPPPQNTGARAPEAG